MPDSNRRHLALAEWSGAGLYDAVVSGFERAGSADDAIMTWIGSDDIMLPGALARVHKIFRQCPEVRWITGQPQTADQDGAWHSSQRRGFAGRNIRWGLHDGRLLPNLMQEGTFWRSSLYRTAGGLRRDLKLAGDFDLWRRFAAHAEPVTCSFPLAVWTHRPGQASRDRAGYYAEVEALRPRIGGLARDRDRPLRAVWLCLCGRKA